MGKLFQDLRYTLRTLRKNPGYAAVAILTLALGIGVNTTLFTVYNAVALRPLPVPDAQRILRIARLSRQGFRNDTFSYPEYSFFSQHKKALSGIVAAASPETVQVHLPARAAGNVGYAEASESEIVSVQLVSGNFFQVLGAEGMQGRGFLPEEGKTPGAVPVAVLGNTFWRRRFNSDPNIIGKTLSVNQAHFTIAGVAPEGFIGAGAPPVEPELWAPLMMQREVEGGSLWLDQPFDRRLQLTARVGSGFTRDQAQAELAALAPRLDSVYPEPDRDATVSLPLSPARFFDVTGGGFESFQDVMYVLVAAICMVLLLACANLANLLLARAASRQKEIAIRLAVGASRARLIRQLLTESATLAMFGGAVGMVFALWSCDVLWLLVQRWLQDLTAAFHVSLSIDTRPDSSVFAYTLFLSLVTGIAFGIVPALQASKPNLTGTLKDEAPEFTTSAGGRRRRFAFREVLIALQVFGCLVLLINAGLFTKSLVKARTADPGFDTQRIIPVNVDPGRLAGRSGSAAGLLRQLQERLAAIPGIQSVGLASRAPFAGTGSNGFTPEGKPRQRSLYCLVDDRYFGTLGIPIIRGRNFSQREVESDAPVVVISENAAGRFWPGEEALGKRIQIPTRLGQLSGPPYFAEVIGIARSVRGTFLSKVDSAYIYLPLSVNSPPRFGMCLLVRTHGDPGAVIPSIRATMRQLDKNLPADQPMITVAQGPMRLQELMSEASALVSGALGTLALSLAAVGIFGVMAFTVSRRTREIGIRMALGASRADVLRLMLTQGMRPVLVGSVFGVLASFGTARAMLALVPMPTAPDLLYGVSPFDPLAFAGVLAFLCTAALLACYIPARKATQVDPMVALRYE